MQPPTAAESPSPQQCAALQYTALHWHDFDRRLQCSTAVAYSTVLSRHAIFPWPITHSIFSGVQCNAVQCSAVQCSAVQCMCSVVPFIEAYWSTFQWIAVQWTTENCYVEKSEMWYKETYLNCCKILAWNPSCQESTGDYPTWKRTISLYDSGFEPKQTHLKTCIQWQNTCQYVKNDHTNLA